MVAAETRHLELILRATIGLIRQVLYLGIHIIVFDKDRLPLLSQLLDARFESCSFSRWQHFRHARPCIGGTTGAQIYLRTLEFNGFDG
jgi:hypothetical protein